MTAIATEEGIEIPQELKDVPRILWAQSCADVGLIRSANPVQIEMKGGKPPSLKQYLLPLEAREGIRPIIEDFLSRGILTPCECPCNTHILLVKKPKLGSDGKPVYRKVQDL